MNYSQMSEPDLYQAIVMKYGEDWNLEELADENPVDELILEYMRRLEIAAD